MATNAEDQSTRTAAMAATGSQGAGADESAESLTDVGSGTGAGTPGGTASVLVTG